MHELRWRGGCGVKIRLLQDLDGHIRNRLARLDFPIMGNACGRRRDIAGGEPHDLCTGDFSAAEFTGSRIALRASLERPACVVQHLAVEDVVDVGPVVVHFGPAGALGAEAHPLEIVIAAMQAVEFYLTAAL